MTRKMQKRKDHGMDLDAKTIAKEIVRQVSTPGDAAAVLIGTAIGAPIDYLLMHLMIPPGYFILTTSTGALGLKKGVDAFFKARRQSKQEQDLLTEERLRTEFEKLKAYLEYRGNDALMSEFNDIYEAWKAGLDRDWAISALHDFRLKILPRDK